MRFDTHRISVFVIEMLQRAGVVAEVTADGGDIIQFRLRSGETVNLYLIESELTLHQLATILHANRAAEIHTLFVLWADLLLPRDGARVLALPDWMAALIDLYSGQIYAFDAFGPDLFVFPVYFEARGLEHHVRYGRTVNAAWLTCETVRLDRPGLRGLWRVALFAASPRERPVAPYTDALAISYGILGLEPGASRASIKRAYRRLARLYHPDVNASPDATFRMQQINDAYETLLESLHADD